MMNNAVLLNTGMELLTDKLGLVEAERFISLLNIEKFDYTEWRKSYLFKDMTIDQISSEAMAYRNRKTEERLH